MIRKTSRSTIIEGTTLPCVRAGRADLLAGVLAELKPGNLANAANELSRWLVDTCKEWAPDWWEGAPEEAVSDYFADHEIAALDRETFRVSGLVIRELLETIATASAAAGWWEELRASADLIGDGGSPGSDEYAVSLVREAAAQGTRLARERDLWRNLAARQNRTIQALAESIAGYVTRVSELAAELLAATSARPRNADLEALAGYFGVDQELAVDGILMAHRALLADRDSTHALLEEARRERQLAEAAAEDLAEQRDRLAEELEEALDQIRRWEEEHHAKV